MLVSGAGEMAGSARLVLVDGAVLLRPEPAVFEAILAGWRWSRRADSWPPDGGRSGKTLRRFQEFTGEYPWQWGGPALRLGQRLSVFGIDARAARRQLAAQVPAVVLAEMLGIAITTAVHWVHAAGDWANYAAITTTDAEPD